MEKDNKAAQGRNAVWSAEPPDELIGGGKLVSIGDIEEHPKLTETAKSIIRYLCTEKPWRKHIDDCKDDCVEIEIEAERPFTDMDVACLMAFNVKQKTKVGKVEVERNCCPFTGFLRYGNRMRMNVVIQQCESIFESVLLYVLDKCGGWKDIYSD